MDMESDRETPTQVRIRTDPTDGYAHRYDAIQDAKRVFDVGNNTAAIVAACEHARQDEQAKREALQFLIEHVEPAIAGAVIERLSTPAMPLSYIPPDVSRKDSGQNRGRFGIE